MQLSAGQSIKVGGATSLADGLKVNQKLMHYQNESFKIHFYDIWLSIAIKLDFFIRVSSHINKNLEQNSLSV